MAAPGRGSVASIGECKVAVGLDLGSTASGFAFLQRQREPTIAFKTRYLRESQETQETQSFYEWPGQAQSYCKTLTCALYGRRASSSSEAEPSTASYRLLEWGWPAQARYQQDRDGGTVLTRFRLRRGPRVYNAGDADEEWLPAELTIERVGEKFLSRMVDLVVQYLRRGYGKRLARRDIQWCLAVPAAWHKQARKLMRGCAERAGLCSPRPLRVVTEVAAAALYCVHKGCGRGDLDPLQLFLLADVGAGTLDMSLLYVLPNGRLRRVRRHREEFSVDGIMMQVLGTAFPGFDFNGPGAGAASARAEIQRWWGEVKVAFPGSFPRLQSMNGEVVRNEAAAVRGAEAMQRLPPGLLRRLSGGDGQLGLPNSPPVVPEILDRAADEVAEWIRAEVLPEKDRGVRVVCAMLVGGLLESAYFRDRVKTVLRWPSVVVTPEPGSAVSRGAALLGMFPDLRVGRMATSTYALGMARFFREGDPPDSVLEVGGVKYCKTALCVFLRNGERVDPGRKDERCFRPVFQNQKKIVVHVYLSRRRDPPRYTTDPGVELWATFAVDISGDLTNQLQLRRQLQFTMYYGVPSRLPFNYGGHYIWLEARRLNFGDTDLIEELKDEVPFNSEIALFETSDSGMALF